MAKKMERNAPVRIGFCSLRPIVEPCELSDHCYQIDPYIGCEHHCRYCYALNRAERDWTKEILVHGDFSTRLVGELSALEPQSIYFGWNSDPYQPAERTRRHTRRALEILAERGFSACILTKSDLVTRDLDLIARMPGSSAGFSLAFQDEAVRTLFEANAPPNARRIAALKAVKEAGIRTYVLVCPVMPYLTDAEALVEMVVPWADTLWFYALNMGSEKDRNWQELRQVLDRHFPELTTEYRRLAFSGEGTFWQDLRRRLETIRMETALDLRVKL